VVVEEPIVVVEEPIVVVEEPIVVVEEPIVVVEEPIVVVEEPVEVVGPVVEPVVVVEEPVVVVEEPVVEEPVVEEPVVVMEPVEESVDLSENSEISEKEPAEPTMEPAEPTMEPAEPTMEPFTSPLILAVRSPAPEPLSSPPACPHLFTKELAFKETYDSAMSRLALFHASHTSDPAIVTFILPTIQRPSLQRAITSLQQQTCRAWKAIILFDGCQPMVNILPSLKDPRLMFASIVKTGTVSAVHSKAGYVRNVGLHWVQTPWVGFLDDDDRLAPDYVERLQEECHITPTADLIVFKMNDKKLILPPPSSTQLVKNEVGISFAYRSSLIQEGFRFVSSEHEDYHLVHAIYRAGKQVVLSPYVTYVVRNSVYHQPDTMDRVCLL
jgi:hypothetical protein